MSLADNLTWRALQINAFRSHQEHQHQPPFLRRWLRMDGRLSDFAVNGFLIALVLLHLICAPYTKVEESFNIQAVHDIQHLGLPWWPGLSRNLLGPDWDHYNFPGAVPRTFVGAFVLSGFAQVWDRLFTSPAVVQLAVRAVLGLANAFSLILLKDAVDTAYGSVAARWFILLQATQFHYIYYSSRTLPNMFTTVLTTLALRELIVLKASTWKTPRSAQRRRLALTVLTIAGIVFRSEIALLLATETLYLLMQRRVSIVRDIIPAGIIGVAIGLSTTVSIDSIYWAKFPLWPEWEGFYYNTILGKSSDWGVSPFRFYFVDSLPRLLLNPMTYLVCIPLAVFYNPAYRTSRDILVPQLVFITLYSFLPHKEWRFIIYTIPAFTAVAAGGAGWIWTRRSKRVLYRLGSFALIASTLASLLASLVLLWISSLNYPGGEALRRLHELAPRDGSAQLHVYMDNLACQTGVTRYQQVRPLWIYDKTEDEETLLSPTFWQDFDYVLAEKPERIIGSWRPIEEVKSFAGISLRTDGEDDHIDFLPIPSALDFAFARKLRQVYVNVVCMLQQKFTRGYWPAIRMQTRIYILEKEPLDPLRELQT